MEHAEAPVNDDESSSGLSRRVLLSLVAVCVAIGPVLFLLFGNGGNLDNKVTPKPTVATAVCNVQQVDNADPFLYEDQDLPPEGILKQRPKTERLRHGLVHGYIVVFKTPSVPDALTQGLLKFATPYHPVSIVPAPDGVPFVISASVAGQQISCPHLGDAAINEFNKWAQQAFAPPQ